MLPAHAQDAVPPAVAIALWVISTTSLVTGTIVWLEVLGLLDGITDTRAMAWFEIRLWRPLRRVCGADALERRLRDGRDAGRPRQAPPVPAGAPWRTQPSAPSDPNPGTPPPEER